jgi:hypothetical protein
MKQNNTKQNKQNKTKQNKTKQTKQNKTTKQNKQTKQINKNQPKIKQQPKLHTSWCGHEQYFESTLTVIVGRTDSPIALPSLTADEVARMLEDVAFGFG